MALKAESHVLHSVFHTEKPDVKGRSANHESGDFKAGKPDQLTVSHALKQTVSL